MSLPGPFRSWLLVATLLTISAVLIWMGSRRTRELELARAAQELPSPANAIPTAEFIAAADEIALRTEIAHLQRELERKQSVTLKLPPPARKESAPPPPVPWRNAGTHTPAAAFESVMWAATTGEFESLAGLIAFDVNGRVQADAFFSSLPPDARAPYASAEGLVAAMMAGRLPLGIEASTVVSETVQAGEALLRVQFHGAKIQTPVTQFRLLLGGGAWKLVVPDKIIEGYRYTVTGASAINAPVTAR